MEWSRTFRKRMHSFERSFSPPPGAEAVSVKIRVTSGCFHREHSPRAYEIIDNFIDKASGELDFGFEEHESGPELLVYVAAVTAGISLATSIINLIDTIIKARSEGIKRGDHPSDPLELIVRRVQKNGEFEEETILRIGHQEIIKPEVIDEHLKKSLAELLNKDEK